MVRMIEKRPIQTNPWSPEGFERFIDFYPETDWTAPPSFLDHTPSFIEAWREPGRLDLPSSISFVLTPGVLAEWLPACFRAPRQALEAKGHRILRSKTSTSLGILAQARVLTRQLLAWLRPDERFVWCGHSKGGLDALRALYESAPLRKRCAALLLVQPPVRASWVIDRWLDSPGTLRERSLGFLLRRRLFSDGIRDISGKRVCDISDWVERVASEVTVLQAASWSIHPTSSVDTFHRQLDLLRPGHAHDGQFFLADQRLPSVPIVGLPALDHAQPVLGGMGFDSPRLWTTLAACALRIVRS